MELNTAIENIFKELENDSLNKQRKRYLESYLEELIGYKNRNPNKKELPNSLEIYCDINPESPECRIYDD